MRSLGELKGCAGKSLFDDFGLVRATAFQPLAKHLNRGRLDENAQGLCAIVLLDVLSAEHIHVAHHIFALCQLVVHLTFQRTVVAVGVNLLIFQEVACCDVFAEGFGGEEEVFHAVLLRAAWRTAGGGDGEMEVEPLLHQVVDDGAFAATAGGGEDDDFHGCAFEGWDMGKRERETVRST